MDVRGKLVELLTEFYGCDPMYYDVDALAIAQHLITHGVTVQEWVSVNDRLPNPFESVLVFRDGKISIDYNEGNGWFAYDFNGKRVTHWMPLPQPPKGDNMQ